MNEPRPTSTSGNLGLSRRLVPMTGRDPEEHGRTASPMVLLFDLTFVVAVGTAAFQFAEMVAEGRYNPFFAEDLEKLGCKYQQ
ncbi:hypothetical protein ABT001_31365 [Streptomyces sp. NPDC002793]|uniref:hypothetical protein n=1 Tax=Streptomyces sp. NPDC002793 TaxID=3154432 RepID=UPI003330044E